MKSGRKICAQTIPPRRLVAGQPFIDQNGGPPRHTGFGGLFAFTEDDGVIGPFDLTKVFDPAVRAQMKGVKDSNEYSLRFSYKPKPTIDDQGLIHASVFTEARDSRDGPSYDLTAQAARAAHSLDVKVLSDFQYLGPSISVTIH